ncbi:MAG: hypothetical protein LBT59_02650 [Clostridiales bacterium]|nr:hypothetical protein [Clostridiales bacterium]
MMENSHEKSGLSKNNRMYISKTLIDFLTKITCKTLAKRIMMIILILGDVNDDRIIELTQLNRKTIAKTRESLLQDAKNIERELVVCGGGKVPIIDENEEKIICEELKANKYRKLQDVAVMIKSKTGKDLSIKTVSRFLKRMDIKLR